MVDVDIKMLRKLHKSGGIMYKKPNDFRPFAIPRELKQGWVKYIETKERYKMILKKYNMEE